MKANPNFYIQTVNTAVTDTEDNGERLSEYFEVLRGALDKKDLAAISTEELSTIKENFAEGTQKYVAIEAKLKGLKAPIKLLGVNSQLLKAYKEFVEGCQAMTDSIDVAKHEVDIAAFDQAENLQDQATSALMKAVERITKMMF
ncbi:MULTISPECIES: hypothetical protein [Carnobacterium]|uniref:hypothetical protein n=1 Tax=Carnobacterium TaxID=2747 RepID=UPI0010721736|nr:MULTISPECIES: hypothetical protein [Carnobacterium]MDT1940579.1 hypothetical protein [Carnobacterium divergens]MDT1943017.1 hypothetical protein [Carnobacterium divergens]MDT1948824.1 hypothetical protein [Carnobacterium divergens]MDT1951304.1 hypothetical protein [Carnobacterium divergens]MDT1956362.1 hypothetical protein [Carnobacterium divergens]